ncbi:acetate uptake transporter family protein [Geomonas sp.]|uniref:acetate uptake transporter family protein n=1 Tax=Geomonas sp. TaxID=2651584 RepID=UPI002B4A9FCD|nr:GPR1/FUN34/YaaH family transporter [Geomonas sp.]HJV35798.1 GPR1/FUN34/YaaH family transporter [Geomonas sp.]
MAIQEEYVTPVQSTSVQGTTVQGTPGGAANVFLQPVAPPSILGMFAFAGATFMIAAWLAGWYGSAMSPFYIAPFVAVCGGIVQLVCSVWAFRARDGLATAIHGTWGAFYLGYGLLYAIFSLQPRLIPMGGIFPELGMWFVVLAAISWVLTLAAMGHSLALAAVMMSVSGGATFAAIGLLAGVFWCSVLGGYLFILASLCALYDGAAQVLKEIYGHEVLKIGYTPRVLAEPGIMAGAGEPGVIHGQR